MEKIDVDELKELVIEMKYNNNIAFEKLYRRYSKLVYGIAFSILKNKHDTEDIVQIVFTKIYSIDKSKLPDKNEASWLYTTTKNETINYLKKKKNNFDLESVYEIEDNNSEINEVIDRDAYNRLISKLSNTEKEIISLKILSKFSFEEIAKIMNIPTGTIKWKYYKSIHTLKLFLSNLGMFIVTFISSIISFKNGSKLSQSIEQENDTIIKDEDISGNYREETEKNKNEIIKDENSQTQENIIETPQIHSTTNYIGIGLMSVSSIFLITTIIFSIILTKHQLKRK